MIATTRDKWIVPCPTVILENIFDTGYRANARPIAKRIGNRNEASSYKIKDTPAATANLKVVLFLSSLILLIIFLLTYCRNGFLRLSHPTVVAGPCPGKSFVSSGKTRILSLIEFKICL